MTNILKSSGRDVFYLLVDFCVFVLFALIGYLGYEGWISPVAMLICGLLVDVTGVVAMALVAEIAVTFIWAHIRRRSSSFVFRWALGEWVVMNDPKLFCTRDDEEKDRRFKIFRTRAKKLSEFNKETKTALKDLKPGTYVFETHDMILNRLVNGLPKEYIKTDVPTRESKLIGARILMGIKADKPVQMHYVRLVIPKEETA